METTSTKDIKSNQGYLNMTDFMQMIEVKDDDNPYSCVLSFDKYIDSISSQYDQSCTFSKGMVPFLKDVENKMNHEKAEVCGQLRK